MGVGVVLVIVPSVGVRNHPRRAIIGRAINPIACNRAGGRRPREFDRLRSHRRRRRCRGQCGRRGNSLRLGGIALPQKQDSYGEGGYQHHRKESQGSARDRNAAAGMGGRRAAR